MTSKGSWWDFFGCIYGHVFLPCFSWMSGLAVKIMSGAFKSKKQTGKFMTPKLLKSGRLYGGGRRCWAALVYHSSVQSLEWVERDWKKSFCRALLLITLTNPSPYDSRPEFFRFSWEEWFSPLYQLFIKSILHGGFYWLNLFAVFQKFFKISVYQW